MLTFLPAKGCTAPQLSGTADEQVHIPPSIAFITEQKRNQARLMVNTNKTLYMRRRLLCLYISRNVGSRFSSCFERDLANALRPILAWAFPLDDKPV